VFAGRTFEYKPFTVLFHRDEITHRDEIGREGARFFMVEVAAGLLERLREHSPVPDVMVGTRGDDLSTLAARLFREHAQPATVSPLVLEGLVMEMLGAVGRNQASEKQVPVWLQQAIELLHDEFDRSLTVADIAARVGIHPFHLSRVFRKFHRLSIGEYVNRLRIEFACGALAEPEVPLAEVAFRAGFADQSHFNRVFKQVTGMTPGAFRATTLPKSSRQ
jgi:AraC family transcriptional regulator